MKYATVGNTKMTFDTSEVTPEVKARALQELEEQKTRRDLKKLLASSTA